MYFDAVLNPQDIKKMCATARRQFRAAGCRPDALVATGLSGLLAVGPLAQALNTNVVAVRKPDDRSNHSGRTVEMYGYAFPKTFVFVDDFVGSGYTFKRTL